MVVCTSMRYLLTLFSLIGTLARAQVSLPPEISGWQSTQLTCEVWETSTDLSGIVGPKPLGAGILSVSFDGDPLINLVIFDHPERGFKIGQRHAMGRFNKSKYDNCFWNTQFVESRGKFLIAYQCHQGDGFRVTSPYSALWISPGTTISSRICAIGGSAPSAAYIARPCIELRSCK